MDKGKNYKHCGVKNWESVTQCPPQYKLIGCYRINSMTLIRDDDIQNVSPLSWIGTPDISSLGPYNTNAHFQQK